MLKKSLCFIVTLCSLAGCATHKDFYATGGSRADGVVDVAYDFSRMETPQVDKRQAYSIARNKCSLWGYGDAEPFGGQSQICQARSGFGECSAWQVSIKYQCLGSLDQAPAAPNYLGTQQRPAAPVAAPQVPRGNVPASTSAPSPLSEKDYRDVQIQQLMQQNLPYDEYQKRYRTIMGQ